MSKNYIMCIQYKRDNSSLQTCVTIIDSDSLYISRDVCSKYFFFNKKRNGLLGMEASGFNIEKHLLFFMCIKKC